MMSINSLPPSFGSLPLTSNGHPPASAIHLLQASQQTRDSIAAAREQQARLLARHRAKERSQTFDGAFMEKMQAFQQQQQQQQQQQWIAHPPPQPASPSSTNGIASAISNANGVASTARIGSARRTMTINSSIANSSPSTAASNGGSNSPRRERQLRSAYLSTHKLLASTLASSNVKMVSAAMTANAAANSVANAAATVTTGPNTRIPSLPSASPPSTSQSSSRVGSARASINGLVMAHSAGLAWSPTGSNPTSPPQRRVSRFAASTHGSKRASVNVVGGPIDSGVGGVQLFTIQHQTSTLNPIAPLTNPMMHFSQQQSATAPFNATDLGSPQPILTPRPPPTARQTLPTLTPLSPTPPKRERPNPESPAAVATVSETSSAAEPIPIVSPPVSPRKHTRLASNRRGTPPPLEENEQENVVAVTEVSEIVGKSKDTVSKPSTAAPGAVESNPTSNAIPTTTSAVVTPLPSSASLPPPIPNRRASLTTTTTTNAAIASVVALAPVINVKRGSLDRRRSSGGGNNSNGNSRRGSNGSMIKLSSTAVMATTPSAAAAPINKRASGIGQLTVVMDRRRKSLTNEPASPAVAAPTKAENTSKACEVDSPAAGPLPSPADRRTSLLLDIQDTKQRVAARTAATLAKITELESSRTRSMDVEKQRMMKQKQEQLEKRQEMAASAMRRTKMEELRRENEARAQAAEEKERRSNQRQASLSTTPTPHFDASRPTLAYALKLKINTASANGTMKKRNISTTSINSTTSLLGRGSEPNTPRSPRAILTAAMSNSPSSPSAVQEPLTPRSKLNLAMSGLGPEKRSLVYDGSDWDEISNMQQQQQPLATPIVPEESTDQIEEEKLNESSSPKPSMTRQPTSARGSTSLAGQRRKSLGKGLLEKSSSNVSLNGSAATANPVQLTRITDLKEMKYALDNDSYSSSTPRIQDLLTALKLSRACISNDVKSIRTMTEDFTTEEELARWVDLKDTQGQTALHHAVWYGRTEIVELLLSYSADANSQTTLKKMTPLHYGCERQNLEVIQTLLQYGAEPMKKNEKEKCALEILPHRRSETSVEKTAGEDGNATAATDNIDEPSVEIALYMKQCLTELIDELKEKVQKEGGNTSADAPSTSPISPTATLLATSRASLAGINSYITSRVHLSDSVRRIKMKIWSAVRFSRTMKALTGSKKPAMNAISTAETSSQRVIE